MSYTIVKDRCRARADTNAQCRSLHGRCVDGLASSLTALARRFMTDETVSSATRRRRSWPPLVAGSITESLPGRAAPQGSNEPPAALRVISGRTDQERYAFTKQSRIGAEAQATVRLTGWFFPARPAVGQGRPRRQTGRWTVIAYRANGRGDTITAFRWRGLRCDFRRTSENTQYRTSCGYCRTRRCPLGNDWWQPSESSCA